MKMNLSVVMKTIDKTSAVVKNITSTQSKYAKQLTKVKEQSQKISGNQALITTFRKTGEEAGKNKQKLNAAQQKLSTLNEKMKAAKKPSESLQNQFKKQQLAVKGLSSNQSEYTKTLTKTQNKLKTAGVNVKRLKSEEKRLSNEYDKRMSQMDKLARKEKRLQKIRSKLSKFKLPKIGGGALAKGGALLGGLSFAGLFSQLNGSAAEMDKLSKAAQNLDMPVEELQAMQSQAKHAGVEADTMTGAMTRFTKRLGVLQTTGAGAMGSFLKKGKNPLLAELKGAKNTQQAYEQTLNAFSKLKTNQEQMAFADAAFGQDGRKMLIMLRAGTDGLTKSRKEFNELGGGVKTKDAKKAEAYNDAMQKVQESIKSIKFAALAPIMEKMTKVFTVFSNKFKNAKWRADVIKRVTDTVTGLYKGFKILGAGIMWATSHFPEIIAGIALLKIGMFALNAVMIANPIGLIVAAVAALVVGIGYLIAKAGGITAVWKLFTEALSAVWEKLKSVASLISDIVTPSVDGMGGTFDRVKAGFVAGVAVIKSQFLIIPRAIMKALSLIPSKLLPDGWGDSIKNAQIELEKMNSDIVNDAKTNIEYAISGKPDDKLQSLHQNKAIAAAKEKVDNVVNIKDKLPPKNKVVSVAKEKMDNVVNIQDKLPPKNKVVSVVKEKTDNVLNIQDKLPLKNKTVNDAKERIDHMINGNDNLKSDNTNENLTKANEYEQKENPIRKQVTDDKILRHPSTQSKSQVEVRIKSDKPVEITHAKSDKCTDMTVDTGDLLGTSF